MPTIYRIACDSCGPLATDEPGCAGAVVTDGLGGVVTQGWYRAVLAKDGHLEPMRHPVEHAALEATGYTGLGATLRGRQFMVTQVLCEDCGALSERRRLDAFSAELGCSSLLLLPAAGYLAGVRSFPELFVGTLVALGFLQALFIGGLRLVHRKRAAEHRSEGCSACGSKKVVSVTGAGQRRFPCPKCGKKSVSVTIAGVS